MNRSGAGQRASAIAVTACLCAVVFRACGSEPQESAPPSPEATDARDTRPDTLGSGGAGGTGADGSVQDSADSADSADSTGASWDGAGPDGCGPFQPPPPVPPGWVEYKDWSCECRLYVPGPGVQAEPIEWEACQYPVPSNLNCRWMKHTWNEGGVALGVFPKFTINNAGRPMLQFSKVSAGGDRNVRYRVVAEADGPTLVAFLQVNPAGKGCELSSEALRGDAYLFSLRGDTWDGDLFGPDGVEGILAGRIYDPKPTAVLKLPRDENLGSNWSVSEDWIVQLKGTRTAWTWDLQTKHVVYNPSTDGGRRGGRVSLVGKDIFVQVGESSGYGVVTWNLQEGLRRLLWFDDLSLGAMNFATDGTNMVWTFGEQKGPGLEDYSVVSVMTAPYTTDPAQVQPRRLRSDVKGIDPYPYVTGCGYAARKASLGDPNHNALFIVRLADGVSWLLPGSLESPVLHWGIPLGFTCEELFTSVDVPQQRLARIRLDSLGPGTPPD